MTLTAEGVRLRRRQGLRLSGEGWEASADPEATLWKGRSPQGEFEATIAREAGALRVGAADGPAALWPAGSSGEPERAELLLEQGRLLSPRMSGWRPAAIEWVDRRIDAPFARAAADDEGWTLTLTRAGERCGEAPRLMILLATLLAGVTGTEDE